jgi:uncharacterized protein (DUF1684 family)
MMTLHTMTRRLRRLRLGLVVAAGALSVSCGGSTPAPGGTAAGAPAPTAAAPAPAGAGGAPLSPTAAIEAWRAKHEVDYRRDFASISGLYPLKAGANTAGSAATNDIVLPASTPASVGTFTLTGTSVRFTPAAGAPVRLKDAVVAAPLDLRDDRAPAPGADELTIGDVRLVVHVSGDERSLRVRDPRGPLATGFLGFAWFPIDLQQRVVGRFVRDTEPRTLSVVNTYGDVDTYTSEGVVEFALQGRALRLRPFTTRPKRFYIVFKDASSGKETYEAARFLYADLADDGSVVLDFNQAYNPPCAFNPFTTCPIPLKENQLPVKILAGEKAYPVKVPLPTRAAPAS